MKKLVLSFLLISGSIFGESILLDQINISERESSEIYDVLAKYGSDPKVPALNKAIEAKDYIASITLIEYGVDVNRRSAKTMKSLPVSSIHLYNDGITPLELAINTGFSSVIPSIILKQGNPYSQRSIKYEIVNGKHVNEKYPPENTTAVSEAIYLNRLDVLQILLDSEVKFDGICLVQFTSGLAGTISYTPLQLAVMLGRREIAEFLISVGAAF